MAMPLLSELSQACVPLEEKEACQGSPWARVRGEVHRRGSSRRAG